MHTWVAVLIVSYLWVCPVLVEAGTAGTTGEQRPEQKQVITKENLKLVQERLKAEGVYAGPVDGELNAQIRSCRFASPPALRVSGDAVR
jgi:hypothetical protein